MEILQNIATGMPTEQLVLGSALVALGLTTLLAAAVAGWRMRRRRARVAAPAAPETVSAPPEDVVVSLEAAVRNAAAEQTRRLAHELARIDQRLEEMEVLVTTLSRRLEETPVPRPAAARLEPAPRPAQNRAAAGRPSPEHEALRALAGRA